MSDPSITATQSVALTGPAARSSEDVVAYCHVRKSRATEEEVLALPPSEQPEAASYARRSEKKEEAVLSQHATNLTRALTDGFSIPSHLRWSDDGTTGNSTSRDGLDALLALISTGKAPFTRLYVRDHDRLARTADPRFSFFVEFLCKMHGVMLCYSTDAKHASYGEGSDEDMIGFLISAMKKVKAYQELADTRKRTMRGTRQALKDGRFVGAFAPYGYDRWLISSKGGVLSQLVPSGVSLRLSGHHFCLRPNPAEMVVVQRIFDALYDRKPYAQIARELEADMAPRPREEPWSGNQVREIARNPIHKGDYLHGRTRHTGIPTLAADIDAESSADRLVLLPGFVPDAPVDADRWQRVQEIIGERATLERQRKHSRPSYLLTSLLRCATCDEPLFGHRQAPRGGVRVRMYRHSPRRGRAARETTPCPHVNRYVRAVPLEEAAMEATRIVLSGEEALRIARDEFMRLRENTSGTAHAAALREAEVNMARARSAAAEANIRAARAVTTVERQIHDETMRTLVAEVEALSKRTEALRAEAERIAEAEARLPQMEERMRSLVDTFASGTPEGRKSVVAAVVDSMLVNYDDNSVEVRVLAA